MKQPAVDPLAGRKIVDLLKAFPKLGIFAVSLFLHGCEYPPVAHSAIVGKWKSNEQLTLRSVATVQGMTAQSRRILANDFFGHIETDIGEAQSRTINQRDDYDSGSEPYEVLEVTDNYVRIKAWSNFFQDYDERVLYLEGNCYYEIFKQFGFRQYFCRIAD
jgi:hypothetical protein